MHFLSNILERQWTIDHRLWIFSMRDYKKIVAYQLADQLVLNVYTATKQYPKEEMFGITSQLPDFRT